MNGRIEIKEEVVRLLNISRKIDNFNDDMDLFGFEYNFSAGDLLIVCMEIKKKYDIDLNEFVKRIKEYTIVNIVNTLCELMKDSA